MNAKRLRTAWAIGVAALWVSALVWGGCENTNAWQWPPPSTANTTVSPSGQAEGDWIIVLAEFGSPTRQVDADRLKKNLLSRTWQGIGVLHDGEQQRSLVYFGPFKQGQDLDSRLKDVHGYSDAQGNRPFRGAYLRELPRPDPPAPAEWNLLNAKGYWSLQIAYFVNPGPAWPASEKELKLPPDWDRKKAAVEAVRELRGKGVPAFFMHGENMSVVTIGDFPQDVLGMVRDPAGAKWDKYDPDKDEYLDPRVKGLRDTAVKNAEGKDDQPYRYNLENGVLRISQSRRLVSGKVETKPRASFLVRIPRGDDDGFGSDRRPGRRPVRAAPP